MQGQPWDESAAIFSAHHPQTYYFGDCYFACLLLYP